MSSKKKVSPLSYVVGYCRVSTTRQADEGESLEHQASAIRSFCAARFPGFEVQIEVDRVSGRTIRRPGIRKIIEAVKRRNCRAVVAVAWDRLFRNLRDGREFIDLCDSCDTAVVAIRTGLDTGTQFGRFAASLCLLFAEQESATIGERVANTWAARRSEKRKGPGLRPFGYVVGENSELRENPKELALLRQLVSKRMAGAKFATLSEFANKSGVPPVRASMWSPSQVRSLITTELARVERPEFLAQSSVEPSAPCSPGSAGSEFDSPG